MLFFFIILFKRKKIGFLKKNNYKDVFQFKDILKLTKRNCDSWIYYIKNEKKKIIKNNTLQSVIGYLKKGIIYVLYSKENL